MNKIIRVSLLSAVSILSHIQTVSSSSGTPLNYTELARSVVKIVAYSPNHKVSMGSGVIISKNEVATNCHITRVAEEIWVYHDQNRYLAEKQAIAPELDLCVLHTTGMSLTGVHIGTTQNVSLEDEVVIAGFPHARGLSLVRGRITGLHPYEGSQILETDAGFIQGSSGGAVFNKDGRLIGLTTFLTISEHNRRYFAIPIDWLKIIAHHGRVQIEPYKIKAFWEDGVIFEPSSIPYQNPG